MDVPQQPAPDDVRVFIVLVRAVEQWWGWLLTGGMALASTMIWRLSADRQKVLLTLEEHKIALDKQEIRLRSLEAEYAAILIKLGDLPTRAELLTQLQQIETRFDKATAIWTEVAARIAAKAV